MRRREFIAGLGSAAAWRLVARGQERAGVAVISVWLGTSGSFGIAMSPAPGKGYLQCPLCQTKADIAGGPATHPT